MLYSLKRTQPECKIADAGSICQSKASPGKNSSLFLNHHRLYPFVPLHKLRFLFFLNKTAPSRAIYCNNVLSLKRKKKLINLKKILGWNLKSFPLMPSAEMCTRSVWNHSMKIDAAAVLSACFSPWLTPGPSHYFFALSLLSLPSLLLILSSLHLLSVSLFAAPSSTSIHCSTPPTIHPPVLCDASVPCSHRSLILLALVGDERGFCLPPAAVTRRHTRGDSQIEDGIGALCRALPRKEFTACGRGEQTCLFVNENVTSLFPSLFTVIFIDVWY